MAGNLTFSEKHRIPIYNDPEQIKNGVVAFASEKCNGCGFCIKACPAGALEMVDKKSRMRTDIFNQCMACGDCVAICPEGVIRTVRSYAFTGYYKTIERGELSPPRL